jgi:phage-related minor tail protein
MAQKKVNGITIAINADTNGVTSGLKELTTQSVSLAKQLKSVDAALKMDPTDTEMLT